MTDSQANNYQREKKFLLENSSNVISSKDIHPKYRPSKYIKDIKEAHTLANLENASIIEEIEKSGSPKQYIKDILGLDNESDPEFQKALQQLEDSKKIYKKESAEPQNFDAKIPEKNFCSPLMQSINSGACNLYSFLGAALNVNVFRKKLKKLIVKEDARYLYIKFPYYGPSKAPQEFKKTFDTVYKVSKEIYSSTTGGLLPSNDPWVQAISRAFYEHLAALGAASPDGYNLVFPIRNGQKTEDCENYELFFGTKVNILKIPGDCIINEGTPNSSEKSSSCQEGLVLKKNGAIEIKQASRTEELDGTNKILIVPSKGHARTLYYDKEWKFFDNQKDQEGQCGVPVDEDSRSSLGLAYEVQIISLPQ